MRGSHRWPADPHHKGSVMQKTFHVMTSLCTHNFSGDVSCYYHRVIWGLLCQEQVSQAGISNRILQYSVGCNYLSMPEIPAVGCISMHEISSYDKTKVIWGQWMNGPLTARTDDWKKPSNLVISISANLITFNPHGVDKTEIFRRNWTIAWMPFSWLPILWKRLLN